jgi:hypothetical protein
MPFSKLFRSRWSALWWAAGVVWFAYDVASANPADNSPPANGAAVEAAINAAM